MKKIRKYVKSKPVHQVIFEIYGFGFLLPLAVIGIINMAYQIMFNGITI